VVVVTVQVLSPLYVICDADACERAGWTIVDFAAACLAGGALVLQVRAKHASAGTLLRMTDAIVQRAAAFSATVVVNDRADIAQLAGAAGVHLGQDDLSPAAARIIVGERGIIGRSTHTSEQIASAVRERVSYIAIGPVFGSATKDTGYSPVGVTRVREAASAARDAGLPVVAIGGITLENAAAVLDAGAQGVAVISDLFATGDPEKRTRAYIDGLSRGRR
jgi:thiamine-phosphate pyrophosphorylase